MTLIQGGAGMGLVATLLPSPTRGTAGATIAGDTAAVGPFV